MLAQLLGHAASFTCGLSRELARIREVARKSPATSYMNGHRSRDARIEGIARFAWQSCAEPISDHSPRPTEAVASPPAPVCVGADRSERLPARREADLQLDELAARRWRQSPQPAAELDGLPVAQMPPADVRCGRR